MVRLQWEWSRPPCAFSDEALSKGDKPMFTYTIANFSHFCCLPIFLFSQTHLWYLVLIKVLRFTMLSYYFYLRKQDFFFPFLSFSGSCFFFFFLLYLALKCCFPCQNGWTQTLPKRLVKHKSFQVNSWFIIWWSLLHFEFKANKNPQRIRGKEYSVKWLFYKDSKGKDTFRTRLMCTAYEEIQRYKCFVFISI